MPNLEREHGYGNDRIRVRSKGNPTTAVCFDSEDAGGPGQARARGQRLEQLLSLRLRQVKEHC
jgi:hypothetical protein